MVQKRTLITLSAVAAIVLLYVLNMLYFSLLPDFFTIEKKSDAPLGAAYVTTTVSLMENELNCGGGWLPNDIIMSPTWWLDNKQSFQLGVLEVVRYNTRVLRDALSRQRTTDSIDSDCDKAFTSFSNDPYKWIFPSAEGKYRQGIDRLDAYGQRLSLGSANFYPRSDNLIQLLEQYVSLLGGVNTRLLNASRRHAEPASVKVGWTQIDDNFYYAQGVGYALCHLFKALQFEFAVVLKDKNADIIVSDWTQALMDCTNCSEGGFTDWRLPNIKELQSLIDYGEYNPALPSDHPFNVAQSWYWSSTTYAYSTSSAWLVHLSNGYTKYYITNDDNYVWCVRGGQ